MSFLLHCTCHTFYLDDNRAVTRACPHTVVRTVLSRHELVWCCRDEDFVGMRVAAQLAVRSDDTLREDHRSPHFPVLCLYVWGTFISNAVLKDLSLLRR